MLSTASIRSSHKSSIRGFAAGTLIAAAVLLAVGVVAVDPMAASVFLLFAALLLTTILGAYLLLRDVRRMSRLSG